MEVTTLEQRIAALEIGKQFDATKEAVRTIEMEYLFKLREIKQALEQNNTSSVVTSIDTTTTTTNEVVDALKQENDTLKQKNAKLEYRVEHLVRNMETLLTELDQLKQQ